MQDGPLVADTVICCLEGSKALLVVDKDTWEAPPIELLQRVPTLALLEHVAKKYKGVVAVLHAGEAVRIPALTWHAAINLARCVSVNLSISTAENLDKVVTASLLSVLSVQGSSDASGGHEGQGVVLKGQARGMQVFGEHFVQLISASITMFEKLPQPIASDMHARAMALLEALECVHERNTQLVYKYNRRMCAGHLARLKAIVRHKRTRS